MHIEDENEKKYWSWNKRYQEKMELIVISISIRLKNGLQFASGFQNSNKVQEEEIKLLFFFGRRGN